LIRKSLLAKQAMACVAAAAIVAACTPQGAPDPPIFTVTNQNATEIQGVVSPCVDDGLPNPPGVCQMAVRVVAVSGGPTAPPLGSGIVSLPESGGAFSISGLSSGTNYNVWVRADDGAKTSDSFQDVVTNTAPAASS